MVIAALVSFGVLLVAWILAPDRPRAEPTVGASLEAQPAVG